MERSTFHILDFPEIESDYGAAIEVSRDTNLSGHMTHSTRLSHRLFSGTLINSDIKTFLVIPDSLRVCRISVKSGEGGSNVIRALSFGCSMIAPDAGDGPSEGDPAA